MITIEQLKVGETYSEKGFSDKTILCIGKDSVFYSYIGISTMKENTASIDYALKAYSIIPKPKKKIVLIGLLSASGNFIEYEEDSNSAKNAMNGTFWTKVSSREIEIE